MFVPAIYYKNIVDYGIDNSGATDVSISLSSLLSTGGYWIAPPGTYKISSPINISKANTTFIGSGNGTIIQGSPTFSGTAFFNITANFVILQKMQLNFASSLTLTNPAANGIEITSAQAVVIEDIYAQYINGYLVESVGGVQANYNTKLSRVRGFQCLAGFHLKGVTASGFGGIHQVSDCYANQTQGGDCWLIEDFLDLEATNIFGEPAVGVNGRSFHIKGNCNAIHVTNFDLGLFPGPTNQECLFIEGDANGSPTHINFSNGIIEGGNPGGLVVNAGSLMNFSNINFYNNAKFGVNFAGGSSIAVKNCTFDGNGSVAQAGSSDFQSAATNNVILEGCSFVTPFGVGAGQVSSCINDQTFTTNCINCGFVGTGFVGNTLRIFNGFPRTIRSSQGFPIAGSLGYTPSGSPFTTPVQSFDHALYVSGGAVTQISVQGTVTGLTSGTFFLPSGATAVITYTVAPTLAALVFL